MRGPRVNGVRAYTTSTVEPVVWRPSSARWAAAASASGNVWFTEIFTALETGIIDGADASGIANNVGLGLYDIVKHANYPGFHSMPSDHLACNKNVWDAMPEAHRTIMSVAMESLALRTALTFEKANAEAVAQLREDGVNIYAWADEDLQAFRDAAQATWPEFATTPEAEALVESHMAYLRQLGLVDE